MPDIPDSVRFVYAREAPSPYNWYTDEEYEGCLVQWDAPDEDVVGYTIFRTGERLDDDCAYDLLEGYLDDVADRLDVDRPITALIDDQTHDRNRYLMLARTADGDYVAIGRAKASKFTEDTDLESLEPYAWWSNPDGQRRDRVPRRLDYLAVRPGPTSAFEWDYPDEVPELEHFELIVSRQPISPHTGDEHDIEDFRAVLRGERGGLHELEPWVTAVVDNSTEPGSYTYFALLAVDAHNCRYQIPLRHRDELRKGQPFVYVDEERGGPGTNVDTMKVLYENWQERIAGDASEASEAGATETEATETETATDEGSGVDDDLRPDEAPDAVESAATDDAATDVEDPAADAPAPADSREDRDSSSDLESPPPYERPDSPAASTASTAPPYEPPSGDAGSPPPYRQPSTGAESPTRDEPPSESAESPPPYEQPASRDATARTDDAASDTAAAGEAVVDAPPSGRADAMPEPGASPDERPAVDERPTAATSAAEPPEATRARRGDSATVEQASPAPRPAEDADWSGAVASTPPSPASYSEDPSLCGVRISWSGTEPGESLVALRARSPIDDVELLERVAGGDAPPPDGCDRIELRAPERNQLLDVGCHDRSWYLVISVEGEIRPARRTKVRALFRIPDSSSVDFWHCPDEPLRDRIVHVPEVEQARRDADAPLGLELGHYDEVSTISLMLYRFEPSIDWFAASSDDVEEFHRLQRGESTSRGVAWQLPDDSRGIRDDVSPPGRWSYAATAVDARDNHTPLPVFRAGSVESEAWPTLSSIASTPETGEPGTAEADAGERDTSPPDAGTPEAAPTQPSESEPSDARATPGTEAAGATAAESHAERGPEPEPEPDPDAEISTGETILDGPLPSPDYADGTVEPTPGEPMMHVEELGSDSLPVPEDATPSEPFSGVASVVPTGEFSAVTGTPSQPEPSVDETTFATTPGDDAGERAEAETSDETSAESATESRVARPETPAAPAVETPPQPEAAVAAREPMTEPAETSSASPESEPTARAAMAEPAASSSGVTTTEPTPRAAIAEPAEETEETGAQATPRAAMAEPAEDAQEQAVAASPGTVVAESTEDTDAAAAGAAVAEATEVGREPAAEPSPGVSVTETTEVTQEPAVEPSPGATAAETAPAETTESSTQAARDTAETAPEPSPGATTTETVPAETAPAETTETTDDRREPAAPDTRQAQPTEPAAETSATDAAEASADAAVIEPAAEEPSEAQPATVAPPAPWQRVEQSPTFVRYVLRDEPEDADVRLLWADAGSVPDTDPSELATTDALPPGVLRYELGAGRPVLDNVTGDTACVVALVRTDEGAWQPKSIDVVPAGDVHDDDPPQLLNPSDLARVDEAVAERVARARRLLADERSDDARSAACSVLEEARRVGRSRARVAAFARAHGLDIG